MNPITSTIKDALKQAGVNTLYLFGSRTQNKHTPQSDFDFGVLLVNPFEAHHSTQYLYDTIYPILSSISRPETLEADVLDIVFLDNPLVPLEIKTHIVCDGRILFDQNPQVRMDVEERILLQTADFAPLRKLMSKALLERPTV